jgi:hypothetical protein
LLARFLTRGVRFLGSTLQRIDRPALSLRAGLDREFSIEGVALVLQPVVTLRGRPVNVSHFPLYLRADSMFVHGEIRPNDTPVAAGVAALNGILDVQFVHAEEDGTRSGVDPRRYRSIGTPLKLPLPPMERLFVHELPSNFPIAVANRESAKRIEEGLAVACRAYAETNRGCTFEVEITVPRLSPQWPLALRVDLEELGGRSIQAWVCGLVLTESDGMSLEGGFDSSISVGTDSVTGRIKFVLPAIDGVSSSSQPVSARFIIRSSGEVAVRTFPLIEHFLSIADIRKAVPVVVMNGGKR